MRKRPTGLRKTWSTSTVCVPAPRGRALNWNDVNSMESQTLEV